MLYYERLRKANLDRDPVNKRALERAAARIWKYLEYLKRDPNRKISLDSAHLEKAFEHHLREYGAKGLLKLGMHLRVPSYGVLNQSDINLVNMLPFHLHGHTYHDALDVPRNGVPRKVDHTHELDPHDLALNSSMIDHYLNSELKGAPNFDIRAEANPSMAESMAGVDPSLRTAGISERPIEMASWLKGQSTHPTTGQPRNRQSPIEFYRIRHNPLFTKHIRKMFPEASTTDPSWTSKRISRLITQGKLDAATARRLIANLEAESKAEPTVGGLFGKYIQTSMRYRKGQGIMDWVARYAPTMLSFGPEDRRRYLYHGSSRAFSLPDMAQTDGNFHNYGVGLYSNSSPDVPKGFSGLGTSDLLSVDYLNGGHSEADLDAMYQEAKKKYGGVVYGDRFGRSKRNMLLYRFSLPKDMKIFNYATNYKGTGVYEKISDYFNDLAKRTGRDDLVNKFDHIYKILHKIPHGMHLDGFDPNPFMRPPEPPTGQRTQDEYRDSYSLSPRGKFAHPNPNHMYGYKLHRAIRLMFEMFGASHSQSHSHGHLDNYMGGPFRNSVNHTTQLLSSLGFSGYRHFDPETANLSGYGSHLYKPNEKRVTSARSVVLFPSAFTDIPLPEVRISKLEGQQKPKRSPTWALPSVRGSQGKFERDKPFPWVRQFKQARPPVQFGPQRAPRPPKKRPEPDRSGLRIDPAKPFTSPETIASQAQEHSMFERSFGGIFFRRRR